MIEYRNEELTKELIEKTKLKKLKVKENPAKAGFPFNPYNR